MLSDIKNQDALIKGNNKLSRDINAVHRIVPRGFAFNVGRKRFYRSLASVFLYLASALQNFLCQPGYPRKPSSYKTFRNNVTSFANNGQSRFSVPVRG